MPTSAHVQMEDVLIESDEPSWTSKKAPNVCRLEVQERVVLEGISVYYQDQQLSRSN